MSKKEITIIVSIILSMYLGFAFIAMEINPAKWHTLGRIFFVVFNLITLLFTFLDDDFDLKRYKD